MPRRVAALPPARAPALAHDVVIAGDMTRRGDRGYRIAEEVRHHAAKGLRVGLLQACVPGPRDRIHPEIQTCVRRGLAEVVAADPAGPCSLLVVHGPAGALAQPAGRRLPDAARVVFVCHLPEDFRAGASAARAHAGETLFAPVDAGLRAAAPADLPLAAANWRPVVADHALRPRSAGKRPAIGWVLTGPGPHLLPEDAANVDLFVMDLDGEAAPTPGLRRLSGYGCPSLDRLADLDALVFPGRGPLPETIVATALSAGAVVVVRPGHPAAFERGLVVAAPEDAVGAVLRLLGGSAAASRQRSAARAAGRERARRGGLDRLLGPRPAAPAAERDREAPRPIMFLPSNGVGVGHVSRLLAVARRIDPARPVLFASQAQAIEAIEQFGYLAEYIPSASYVGGRFETWDAWFRHELEGLVDAYDPSVVVYDGNNPSDGLVEAIASRRDCRLAWVRRGLWGTSTSRFMPNARWFDLVLEPGELEGQPDEGVTAARSDEAIRVPPVTLLDERELQTRADAARALGLDPARPSVLIHVGAGYNRDIVSLIDRMIGILQQTPQLQISIAEWVNASQDLTCWPGVTYLRGFPLSQHFRAFDFSIAAAGYNSFHEVIAFGLPTIFVPNRHPSMDDQGGRADLAQDLSAAFVMEEDELDDLPELVRLLLDDRARDFLVRKCQALRTPNGAGEIARRLERLSGDAP